MSERVLIYGSRTWTDECSIRAVVAMLAPDAVVIHGGAEGADSIAGKYAAEWGIAVEVYRAQWNLHGRAAGPIRSQQMLDEGQPTRAYGFRMPGESRGTDYMTSLLVKRGIPHEIVSPASTDARRAPESGRVAGATNAASGAPDASVGDQSASPAHDAAREER